MLCPAGSILVEFTDEVNGRAMRTLASNSPLKLVYIARVAGSPLWEWEDIFRFPKNAGKSL